jgi:hypothetical protein
MLVLVLNQIEMLQLIWVRFNRCTIVPGDFNIQQVLINFPMMYQVVQINNEWFNMLVGIFQENSSFAGIYQAFIPKGYILMVNS